MFPQQMSKFGSGSPTNFLCHVQYFKKRSGEIRYLAIVSQSSTYYLYGISIYVVPIVLSRPAGVCTVGESPLQQKLYCTLYR